MRRNKGVELFEEETWERWRGFEHDIKRKQKGRGERNKEWK